MGSLLEMSLRPIVLVSMSETEDYWNEFIAHGEKEKVLWGFESMDVESYYRLQKADERNRRFGFFIDRKMVGMLRVSSAVNYEANGKIGYSIRPTQRGKRYSILLLRMAVEYCHQNAIENVTACVDVRNIASIHALRSSGLVETGRCFDWLPNPLPRKAMEFVLSK